VVVLPIGLRDQPQAVQIGDGRVGAGGLGQGHRRRGGILSRNFGTHFVTTGDDKKGRFWDGKRDVLWG
jgi:hypothetical protein